MEAKKTEATPSPFEGQGGSFYINPAGSNTLKRNRDDEVPFGALSNVEKYARIMAVPASKMTERDRENRIAAIGLTDDDRKSIAAKNSPAPAQQSAEPTVAASAATVADAAPVTSKKQGAK